MKPTFLIIGLLVGSGAAYAQRAKEEPLTPSITLTQLMPKIKAPASVMIRSNVFGLGNGVSVQFPADVGGDHLQQLTQKLTDLFRKNLSSVIRHANTPTIILFEGKVFRPGDELFLGKSNEPQPLQPKTRVIFDAVTNDNIELTVIAASSDGKRSFAGEKVQVPLTDKYSH